MFNRRGLIFRKGLLDYFSCRVNWIFFFSFYFKPEFILLWYDMKTFNIALLGSPQKYIWQQLSQIWIETRQSSVRSYLVPSAERDPLQQMRHGSHVFFHSRMGEKKIKKKKKTWPKHTETQERRRSVNSCLTSEGRPGVHLSWAERPRTWKETDQA